MENMSHLEGLLKSKSRWSLQQGDVQHVLPTLPSSLYDGVITDPPYGLNFMDLGWDSHVPPISVWENLLQSCKPGAYLLAFGGAKTFHRLICNIEDAGWEIRDTICWLYGEGFPKGLNISKALDKHLGCERPVAEERETHPRSNNADHRFGYSQSATTLPETAPASNAARSWEGYSTALKPAWEPIVLAQKPRRGTFAKNVLEYGCGGLNIGGCRIGSTDGTKRSHQAPYPRLGNDREDRQHWARTGHVSDAIDAGRWPANLLLDQEAARVLDRQSGKSRSRRGRHREAKSNVGNSKTLRPFPARSEACEGFDDEGGASRFFYVAKARGKERNNNDHPTVKPLALCEYLGRLILPALRKTPRQLLVPFSGSGSEMLGALMSGWDHVTGIEREARYVKIAKRRLDEFDTGSVA